MRKTHNADVPVASLTAAHPFVKRFLAWCANNGNTGPTDWPTLHELSEAFAFESGMRPITERALCRVLTRLDIPKYKRDITDAERPSLRRRGQSDARRPRVTVYVVPDGELPSIDDDRQLEFFE